MLALLCCFLTCVTVLVDGHSDDGKTNTDNPLMQLLAQQVSSLDKRLNQMSEKVELIRRKISESKTGIGGVQYTHWGRTHCTSVNAETVYTGFIGGSYYAGGTGGAPNKLCLPHQPQWGVYDDKVNDSPYIGATLMDNWDINIKDTLFDKKYTYYRLECASCLTKSTTSTTMMIPGRHACYDGWRKEYSGYLMSGYPGHTAASEYLCLDGKPDFLHKIPSWSYKSIIFSVYSKCNGATSCPPYVEGREMVCVVCSK